VRVVARVSLWLFWSACAAVLAFHWLHSGAVPAPAVPFPAVHPGGAAPQVPGYGAPAPGYARDHILDPAPTVTRTVLVLLPPPPEWAR